MRSDRDRFFLINKKHSLKLQDLLSLDLCLKSSFCFEKITIELALIDEEGRSKLFHEILKWRPKERIVFELKVDQMDFESAKYLALALISRKDLVHVFFKIACRNITKEGLEYLLGVDDMLDCWGDFTTGYRLEYQPLGELHQVPDSPIQVTRKKRSISISSVSSEEACVSSVVISEEPVIVPDLPDPASSPRSSSCCVLS